MGKVNRCGTCDLMGDIYVMHKDAWPDKDGICLWRGERPFWVIGVNGHPVVSNDDGANCPAWRAKEPDSVNAPNSRPQKPGA